MFSPYHRFTNCQRLEGLIHDLQTNNNVPQIILNGHQIYHYTLVHKLKSAEHYIQCLDFDLAATPPADIFSREFLFSVNRSIDGFFLSGGSALDILAREVLVYFNIPLPPTIYFGTAREQLEEHRAHDPIISRLCAPAWKSDFSNYRNALTHEILIAGSVVLNLNLHAPGGTLTGPIILPLPDDPRSGPSHRTYRRHPDVLDYCKTTLRRILSLVNVVYGELTDRITLTGRLPL